MEYRGGRPSMAIADHAQPLRIGSLPLQPGSAGAILQMAPTSIFKDAAPEEWQPHVTLNASGNVELALTCLVVRVGDRTILVDTGYGPVPDRPEVGLLPSALGALSISASDIDTVVLSHPHGDHVGGAVVGNEPAFPEARHWLPHAARA